MWQLIKPVPVRVGGVPVFVRPNGNLGYSYVRASSVNSLVKSAAAVTGSLVFGGVIVWLLMALPIGILSALRPRSVLDRTSMTFVLIGISAHPIWIGLIFAYIFGFRLGWFPISGYCNFFNAAGGCGGAAPVAYPFVGPWATSLVPFPAAYAPSGRANRVLEPP